MRATKVINILVALTLTNFVSAKSLRIRNEKVLNKRFWGGPEDEDVKSNTEPVIDWTGLNNTTIDTKTDSTVCSEKITSKGYKCCSTSCVPSYTDKDGDWAVENGYWCGCGNKSSTNTGDENNDSKCSSKILEKGYECCPSECKVEYVDINGTWGIYNDEWCGCNPKNDKNYMKKWLEEYNKRVREILADDKEIEKKWLINKEKIPYDLDSPFVEKIDIKQTYIFFDPEIRVREYTLPYETTKSHEMTIKTNLTEDGLIRDETNIEINQEQYDNLVKKQEGNTIYKTRYQLLDRNDVIAIDIFHGDLDGLSYMEIEFANKTESDAYKTPDWVIKDVTNDIRYKNGHLARYGIPELEE